MNNKKSLCDEYIEKAYKLLKDKQYQQVIDLSKKVISSTSAKNDKLLYANVVLVLGFSNLGSGKYSEAIKYGEKTKSLCKKDRMGLEDGIDELLSKAYYRKANEINSKLFDNKDIFLKQYDEIIENYRMSIKNKPDEVTKVKAKDGLYLTLIQISKIRQTKISDNLGKDLKKCIKAYAKNIELLREVIDNSDNIDIKTNAKDLLRTCVQ